MLKKSLFTLILLVGCSFAAFGQNNDNREKPPPKQGEQPTVNPKEKPKPTPKPTPKKPNEELFEAVVSRVFIG